ncbi:MAG: ABC transporter permease [Bacteriovoracaceae bacterium]|nr:ABC transporter permease [Bacteriovoracaceae bacterium]
MKKINTEISLGIIIIAFLVFWSIGWELYGRFVMGSFLSPYTPASNIQKELIPPGSGDYLLGTDIYGRSVLEILSIGLSYSLSMALLVSFSAVSIGIIVGYLSVVGHKWVRVVSDLSTNLIFIFPRILIAIMIMSVTGQSFAGLLFALVITSWPGYAKIARGETMRVMGLAYVESAKAVGMSDMRLFFTVVLPSILPLLLVHFVMGISGVIISEATLGFLGLGGSEYSWGTMLSMAKNVLLEAPYLVIILSLSMVLPIMGLNLLGDGLRDYLDPHSSKE